MDLKEKIKNEMNGISLSYQRAKIVSLFTGICALLYHFGVCTLFYKIEVYPMFLYNLLSILIFLILVIKVPKIKSYVIPYLIALSEVVVHQILAEYCLGSYCSFHSFIILMGLLPFLVFENKYNITYPITVSMTILYVILCNLEIPAKYEVSQTVLCVLRIINISITVFIIVFMVLIYTRIVQQIEDNLKKHYNMIESEIKMAAVIQKGFLKQNVQYLTNFEVAYFVRPMVEVSGDLVDFFKTDEKLDGLGIFDVSGHGISSGMVTMLVKNIIHQEFYNNSDLELWEVLNKINDRVIAEKGGIQNYLTGILVRIHKDKIELVSAGHPLPILYKKKTGKCSYIEPHRESVGVIGIAGFPTFFESQFIDFEKGDELIFYSDGVIDIKNSDDEYFGKERLLKTVMENINESANAQMKLISKSINNFCGRREQNDDLTIIVLKK